MHCTLLSTCETGPHAGNDGYKHKIGGKVHCPSIRLGIYWGCASNCCQCARGCQGAHFCAKSTVCRRKISHTSLYRSRIYQAGTCTGGPIGRGNCILSSTGSPKRLCFASPPLVCPEEFWRGEPLLTIGNGLSAITTNPGRAALCRLRHPHTTQCR